MSGSKPTRLSAKTNSRTVAVNRRAYHDYHVLDTVEAGIVLTGTEMKSIRQGKVSITESFARIEHGEMYLYGAQIAPYAQGNIYNHQQDRVRKLLLKRSEIQKLIGKTKEKGLTLIPLKLYFKNAWIKVELGLCKGKQLYDKRESLKAKEGKREIERAVKQANQ
jgi:SsrA-binding protein